MRTLPVWSICLLAAGFGYLGGVAGKADVSVEKARAHGVQNHGTGQMILADAQIPPAGSQGQGGVRIQASQQVSEIVMIGETLRISSQKGQPVAAFLAGKDGGGLVLFDSAGQPTVSITAGSQGRVAITTAQSGGMINMGAGTGAATIQLTGNPDKASLSVMGQGQNRAVFGAIASTGGGLTLYDRKGSPMVELLAQAGNGAGFFKKSDGKVAFEVSHDPNLGGYLRAYGEKESRRVDLMGETGVQFLEKGEAKAKLPGTN